MMRSVLFSVVSLFPNLGMVSQAKRDRAPKPSMGCEYSIKFLTVGSSLKFTPLHFYMQMFIEKILIPQAKTWKAKIEIQLRGCQVTQ